MGTMPVLDMRCEWLPVDTLAENVMDLAGFLCRRTIMELIIKENSMVVPNSWSWYTTSALLTPSHGPKISSPLSQQQVSTSQPPLSPNGLTNLNLSLLRRHQQPNME